MAKRTRSQSGRLSRRKGATFERKVANALKEFYPDARRQPQSQIKQIKAIAATQPDFKPCLTDVVAGPFGIECKHRKVLPMIEDTLQQASEDVGQSGKVPLAVHLPHGAQLADAQVAWRCGDKLRVYNWASFLDLLRLGQFVGNYQ